MDLITYQSNYHIYETIPDNATAKGMKVNPRKTKLLCISAAQCSEVSSFIEVDGERIESADSLKVVGFTFGRRPG